MNYTHKFESAPTRIFKSGDKIYLNSKYDLAERDLGTMSLEVYIPCGTEGKFIGKEVAINIKTNEIDQETYVVQIPKNNLYLRVNYNMIEHEKNSKLFRKRMEKEKKLKKNKNIIYVSRLDDKFDTESHLMTYYFSKSGS